MIDVNFDFTSDNVYWDHFWQRRDLGGGACDPDVASPTLRKYHKILWSKKLPSGEFMDLQYGTPVSKNYLVWKDFRFASDSILATFRYDCMVSVISQVKEQVPNFKEWMEDFIRKSYTIGGMLIFPKHKNSINGCRGTNPKIRDRIDLTMECIRRYYNGEDSPLNWVFETDKKFFDLFVDFKGYVDFFFMNDIVSDDYKSVKFFLDFDGFKLKPLPKNVDEYFMWRKNSGEFLRKRNERIDIWQKANLKE